MLLSRSQWSLDFTSWPSSGLAMDKRFLVAGRIPWRKIVNRYFLRTVHWGYLTCFIILTCLRSGLHSTKGGVRLAFPHGPLQRSSVVIQRTCWFLHVLTQLETGRGPERTISGWVVSSRIMDKRRPTRVAQFIGPPSGSQLRSCNICRLWKDLYLTVL